MLRKLFILAIVTISISITSVSLLPDAFGTFSPTTPVIITDKVPSITDFKKMTEEELLKDYVPFTINRQNDERISLYYFYDSKNQIPTIIGYVEDSTKVELPKYYTQNFDHIEWYLEMSPDDKYYIYAEHDGNSCLFPFEKYSEFIVGEYTGCDGGAVEVKQLENGFALYAKFFKKFDAPTVKNPYTFFYNYIDYQSIDEDKFLKDYQIFYYPDEFTYGKAVPLTDKTSNNPIFISGKYDQNVFSSLTSNNSNLALTDIFPDNSFTKFKCADNTISIKSDKPRYEIDDVANVVVNIESQSNENKVRLKIFDSDNIEIFSNQKNLLEDKSQKFLVDLAQFKQNQTYRLEAELGTDGPKNHIFIGVGDSDVPIIEPEKCQIFTLYDKTSKTATFLIHIDDPSNAGYDQIQIHIDKNGDSKIGLDANDESYTINTNKFGAGKYTNDGGWEINAEFYDQGRISKNSLGYNVFLKVNNVSENFKFSIEQIDNTGYDLKTTRFPENGFSIYPQRWIAPVDAGEKLIKNESDKYAINEISQKIPFTINLITVGTPFDQNMKNMIKKNLETKYSPIIDSSLQRTGIEYSYNYNFVDIPESESKKVSELIKNESQSWKGIFPGENEPFEESWGLGPWIQMNHTEWIKMDRYNIKYKIMDASKMEEFLNENIIKTNPEFSKNNSSNLIFINLDMDDVDFLRTYGLHTKDSVTEKYHDAVGLMGFGGKYNMYFFDLYSVPWDDYQGLWTFFYDQTWNNNKINFHDIQSSSRKAQLISDYVNNSTSKIVTPSLLYPTNYYPKVNLDFFVVSNESNIDIPQLKKYFVDEAKIIEELSEFMPLTDWSVNITVSDVKDRGFPKDLKKIFDDAKFFPYLESKPEVGGVRILDSEKLSKVVIQWAEENKENTGIDNIPVILFVDGKYAKDDLWLDSNGLLGLAPANPDDPNKPCCAYGVISDHMIWDSKVSPNKLLVHELGHALGLMHPFNGYDNEGNFSYYDYFKKYTSSVMGYNAPYQRCALWYDYLVEDIETCGNADPEFTQFEKNYYYRHLTVQLQKDALSKIHQTSFEYEKLGKALSDNSIQEIKKLINDSITKMKNEEFLGNDGSIKIAYKALQKSENLEEKITASISPLIKQKVPDWVKNNAKWWADGQVDDSTFSQGIGFLIKEKVISVSSLPPQASPVAEEKIPDWIKNNANWWAEGMISEDDFLKGITYMVEKGIVKVK